MDGFERGAGIQAVEVAIGFEWLLGMVMIIATVAIVLGAFSAWSDGQLSVVKLVRYVFRALILLVVTLVMFGALN